MRAVKEKGLLALKFWTLDKISRFYISGSLGNYRGAFAFVPLDGINRLPAKFSVPLETVQTRVDVSGLREAGVAVAADDRTFNRGNFAIGPGWTAEFNHSINPTGIPVDGSDYRFVVHETIRMMFVEKAPWRETPEYAHFRYLIEKGCRHQTLGELELRGRKLHELFEKMLSEGWLPAPRVGRPFWDEVHLYVGAQGELCAGRHGNHRMAIARLIGIETFPALLGGIHIEFLESQMRADARPDRRDLMNLAFGILEKNGCGTLYDP